MEDDMVFFDPEYKGPKIIQSYLKKTKQILSIGRIFTQFNKRYFTLNIEQKKFFYTPKNTYELKDITEIPLRKIKEVKINKEQNQCPDNWKFCFIISSIDRDYYLHCESETVLLLWVQGFSSLYLKKTKLPLFIPEGADKSKLKKDPPYSQSMPILKPFKANQPQEKTEENQEKKKKELKSKQDQGDEASGQEQIKPRTEDREIDEKIRKKELIQKQEKEREMLLKQKQEKERELELEREEERREAERREAAEREEERKREEARNKPENKVEPVVLMKQENSLHKDKLPSKLKDQDPKKEERRPTTFKAEDSTAKRLSTKSEATFKPYNQFYEPQFFADESDPTPKTEAELKKEKNKAQEGDKKLQKEEEKGKKPATFFGNKNKLDQEKKGAEKAGVNEIMQDLEEFKTPVNNNRPKEASENASKKTTATFFGDKSKNEQSKAQASKVSKGDWDEISEDKNIFGQQKSQSVAKINPGFVANPIESNKKISGSSQAKPSAYDNYNDDWADIKETKPSIQTRNTQNENNASESGWGWDDDDKGSHMKSTKAPPQEKFVPNQNKSTVAGNTTVNKNQESNYDDWDD